MTQSKEQVQEILDNFFIDNVQEFVNTQERNPQLYNTLIETMDFLSRRFGTGQQPVAQPQVQPQTTTSTTTSTTTIQETVVVQMSEQDIKEIIAGLELIADFDDDAKATLIKMKADLKELKKKKKKI